MKVWKEREKWGRKSSGHLYYLDMDSALLPSHEAVIQDLSTPNLTYFPISISLSSLRQLQPTDKMIQSRWEDGKTSSWSSEVNPRTRSAVSGHTAGIGFDARWFDRLGCRMREAEEGGGDGGRTVA